MEQQRNETTINVLMDQIRSYERMTPFAHSLELKNAINSEIERLANQKRASQEMEQERKARVSRQLMGTVLENLTDTIARRTAAKESREEQLEQLSLYRRHEICEELRRKVNRSRTSLTPEQDRQDIVQLINSLDPKVKSTKFDVNSVIERRGNQKAAIEAMENERVSRIQEQLMEAVCEELPRRVNQISASLQMDIERQQRITRSLLHDICEQVRRTSNIESVKIAAEDERIQRVAFLASKSSPKAVEVPEYYGPSMVEFARDAVKEAIVRRGNKIENIKAMAQEQAERRQAHFMKDVMENLRRTVARKYAAIAIEEEQKKREIAQRMHDVCADIRSTTNRMATAALVKEEQTARTESGILRTYWTVDPKFISETKHDINEAISKIGQTKTVVDASALEQAQRKQSHLMKDVLENLRRTVARTNVIEAMTEEKEQRHTRHKMHDVCSDIRSATNRLASAELAREEQTARTESGILRTYWTVDPKVISETKHDINDAIRKQAQVKYAREASDLEKEERINRQSMDTVFAELLSATGRNTTKEAEDIEKAQRVARNYTHDVCEEIRRTCAAKDADRAMKVELEERIASFGNQPHSPVVEAVICDITRRGNQKNAVDQMEEERCDRIREDQVHSLCESIRRFVAQKHADQVMKEVQQAEIARMKLSEVIKMLVKQKHRKEASKSFSIEQDRIKNREVNPTYKKLQEQVCREIQSPISGSHEVRSPISGNWVTVSTC